MKIKTLRYKNIISEVLVDDREGERVDYALTQYSEFNPRKEHLDVGDYIFISPKGVKVAFEYKTGEDFLTSISNNHLHNQYYDLVTNFDYAFIIVECENLMETMQRRYYSTGLDMSLSQVNGAISDFTVASTVLFSQTQYQAFDLMMRVAGKIFINQPLRYKYGKKMENPALNYLSSIRGIHDKAETICATYNIESLYDLMELTSEELILIEGIGEITAEKIMQKIHGQKKV